MRHMATLVQILTGGIDEFFTDSLLPKSLYDNLKV
jgi:hypothetical protein